MSNAVLSFRGRHFIALVLAGLVVGFAHPVEAHGIPEDAVAWATYGKSEIWLQRKASDRAQLELVFLKSRDARPLVLDITLPPHDPRAVDLGMGLDARGRLAVVMVCKRGLYWTRVTGTPRMRRVPGTIRGDSSPSIFRGQLAYDRLIEKGTEQSDSAEPKSPVYGVRLGSLNSASARTVWANRSDSSWYVVQTAIGAGSAVVVLTAQESGASHGSYMAELVRPGSAAKRLRILRLGETHAGFLTIRSVSASGRRLTILRRFDGVDANIKFALPTGRRIP